MFIPQIDGLRFVALIAIIAYHVRMVGLFHFGLPADTPPTDPVSRVCVAGQHALSLFFLVSGFILSLPFARQYLAGGKPIRLREYFMRRLTRIEPPYFIHLAILFLLCVLVYRHLSQHQAMYGDAGWLHYTLIHIGASLVYANGFVFDAHPYPNMVLWSLETEVQFYLLAPFAAKIFRLGNRWCRRGILIGAVLIAPPLVGLLGQHYYVWVSFLGNMQYFFAGFLLADIYVVEGLRPGRSGFIWDAVFVGAGLLIVWLHARGVGGPVWPWIMFAICLAVFLGRLVPALLARPWVVTIGGMCYTIYLYHLLLISVLFRATGHLQTHILWLDLLIQFFVMTPIIFIVSAGLFVVLERPFMQRDWPAKAWATVVGRGKK